MNTADLTDFALNELLLHIYEDQQAYAIAIKHTDDQEMIDFFEEKSLKRFSYEKDIKAILDERSSRIDQSGTLIGKARNAWLDIKAHFTKNSQEQILEGIFEGEALTLRYYKKLLNKIDLSDQERTTIENHMAEIKRGMDKIQAYKKQGS